MTRHRCPGYTRTRTEREIAEALEHAASSAPDWWLAFMGVRDYAMEAALQRGETVTIQEETTRWR